jgi:hypothetical protein
MIIRRSDTAELARQDIHPTRLGARRRHRKARRPLLDRLYLTDVGEDSLADADEVSFRPGSGLSQFAGKPTNINSAKSAAPPPPRASEDQVASASA